MNYSPSTELAQILLANGFTETTKQVHPAHHNDIEKSGYDPGGCKRRFRSQRRKRYAIEFNYIELQIELGSSVADSAYSITTDELKSIVVYADLDSNDLLRLRDDYLNVTPMSLNNIAQRFIDGPFYRSSKAHEKRLIHLLSAVEVSASRYH